MHRRAASTVVLILAMMWASPFAFAAPQESRPKRQTAARQTAMTGCVDEKEGRYVLIHDQTRDLIANLEAEGFPTEGFARHLGTRVTVRGAASEGSTPVFRVRSIETVSETCGPQQP
jgi:hypothetical protein